VRAGAAVLLAEKMYMASLRMIIDLPSKLFVKKIIIQIVSKLEKKLTQFFKYYLFAKMHI